MVLHMCLCNVYVCIWSYICSCVCVHMVLHMCLCMCAYGPTYVPVYVCIWSSFEPGAVGLLRMVWGGVLFQANTVRLPHILLANGLAGIQTKELCSSPSVSSPPSSSPASLYYASICIVIWNNKSVKQKIIFFVTKSCKNRFIPKNNNMFRNFILHK